MTITKHRLFIVTAVAALAVAISVAMLAGGGGTPAGPASALAQAAETTAAVQSGVATSVLTLPDGQTAEVVMRFDGENAEVSFDEILPEGGTRHRLIRVVDGAGFEQQEDGSWAQLEGEAGDAVAAVKADIGDQALLDAVGAAGNVTQEGDVYTAQLAPEQLAGIDNALLATGDAPPADGAAVQVQAGTDGLIRSISIDSGAIKRTVTYTELGEPQAIAAPN